MDDLAVYSLTGRIGKPGVSHRVEESWYRGYFILGCYQIYFIISNEFGWQKMEKYLRVINADAPASVALSIRVSCKWLGQPGGGRPRMLKYRELRDMVHAMSNSRGGSDRRAPWRKKMVISCVAVEA